ncbi:lipoprotein ABC transporter ATP-binding protein, partial [Xanthomonas citri pv. citri]|nr:lipoprotein ABC transporter ATP-binding protein [Xanthomonas citri pv. citri]
AIALLREHADAGAAVLVASHDPLVHAAVDRAVRIGED